MSGWRSVQIADVGRVVTGKTPPSAEPELFVGCIPFITPSDMADDCRHIATERSVSRKWDPKFRQLLPQRSVCVVCIGATIGKICMTSEPSHTNQQLNSIIVDHDRFDPFFVYYSLRTKVSELKAHAAGAATPIINKSTFSEIVLDAPCLGAQRRIGEILGAYDDLIEVNRRRVKLLEEMARGLFEEWFVRFRFPSYESVPLFDTPNGPLPEGWQLKTLSEACVFLRGKSYRSDELAVVGGMPFVNLKCVLRDGGFRADGLKRFTGEYKPNHVVVRGDIVMAVTDMTQERRIVGRVARMPLLDEASSVISMDLVKVKPASEVDSTFLYCWFRYSGFGPLAAQHANGANVLHLSPKAIEGLPIVFPSIPLQKEFGARVKSLFNLADFLAASEIKLTSSRDLLLPRLISGQLSVEAAEQQLAAE